MHSRNSPNVPKNTAQESSEKTITDIHQQPSEETDDTLEDTTCKIPPLGHDDESEFDDEVLVKRMKKIKQGTKFRPKKMQVRSKKCVKAQLEKKEDVQKSPKPPVMRDLYKWLVDIFHPYSVTLYISRDKRIEITLIDVHLTLALPIGGRKVEEFYGEKPKDAKYNEVLDVWRKDWNLQDETPSAEPNATIHTQPD
ncbi:hypothetical protein Cgig2_024300 [Carnegiea gigantea]|uniref:Uncharacterized protein n=1 Tax=Carnegiea gigantea TaxID=171969 RepID=A0A9Q1JWR7_9CARY|nr:hypothetical protein Cgig2_024300 [Carnegiea gigantea]